MLGIDPDKEVDFIRWHIGLTPSSPRSGNYAIELTFGVSQPNTRGFVGGGEQRTLSGPYALHDDILELRDANGKPRMSLIKLNDQVYHVLAIDGKLLVGNGGWSYTLNKKDEKSEPIVSSCSRSFASSAASVELDASQMAVYDGRTPCKEFSRYYDFKLGDGCFKLKWRLSLSRNPATGEPASYTIKMVEPIPDPNSPVDHTYREKTGSWKIISGTADNPRLMIYELSPDDDAPPLRLLAGNENILFLLDKENRLLPGNEDFSYTFNRKGAE
jgi:hypothetical protein